MKTSLSPAKPVSPFASNLRKRLEASGLSASELARRLGASRTVVWTYLNGTAASQETQVLAEGTVLIQWPNNLSQESVEDFEYWVAGLLRRIRRAAGLPPQTEKDQKKN